MLSWALRVLQIHQINGHLEVPMLFHQGQRELGYGPASTSSAVHRSTDLKAGRSGFLEDPSQTEMVSKAPVAPCLSHSTLLLSSATCSHLAFHLYMDCNLCGNYLCIFSNKLAFLLRSTASTHGFGPKQALIGSGWSEEAVVLCRPCWVGSTHPHSARAGHTTASTQPITHSPARLSVLFTLDLDGLGPIGPWSHIQRCHPRWICWPNSIVDAEKQVDGKKCRGPLWGQLWSEHEFSCTQLDKTCSQPTELSMFQKWHLSHQNPQCIYLPSLPSLQFWLMETTMELQDNFRCILFQFW